MEAAARSADDSPMHSAGYVLDPEYWDHDVSAAMPGFVTMTERLLPKDEDRVLALQQLATFRSKLGLFGREPVIKAASGMPAAEWWTLNGGLTPQLQTVAVKVLAQPSSACACERNWSTFDFIHSKRRNRLKVSRAADLVYVHSNLRLKERVLSAGYAGGSVPWEESEAEENSE